MEINSLQNPFQSGQNSSSTTNVEQGGERDLFLSLLVAQLKNQDPLSPQDGTEFVAQLAQFNSLDQLISIRNSIERLASVVPTNNNSQNS